ncbi:MAG TPA: molybdenum cofactor biosynthesis protein MoaE [Opitutaceae bacterium]|nr:molybdenum cofactor biosynthesis protein MoaE [Opitutaceae bacterium]
MDFKLTDKPIDGAALMAGLRDTRAGACVAFEGRVRGESGGRAVTALDYEAYAPLAEKEGERILSEAREKFGVTGAVCAHRTGSLALGETAVWVAVAAGHRDAAFKACRYIIDETKARVPIWKREHYADGATEWVSCATRAGTAGGGAGGGKNAG